MAIIIIQGAEELAAHIHYEVDSEASPLGTGGMGQVRRGVRVDEKSGMRSEVAIKFLFDDLPPSTIERARREASIRIHNDNLVEMLGFIKSEENGVERYHVVSELLHGVMLYDILNGKTTDSEGKQVEYARQLMEMRMSDPERFALTIMKSVLSGVMALHDTGHIHRDIDPSNIMVTSDGKIKLLDFGIAKDLNLSGTQDHQFTSTGVFMGKAGYAAPELVLGDVNNQNESTDIYALGIIMFQLLTGRLPFEGSANEVMQMQCKEKMPLKEIRNKELRKIVGKATEKKQTDRYRTTSAMRVALEEAEIASTRKGTNSSVRVFTSSGDKSQKPISVTSAVTPPIRSNKLKKVILTGSLGLIFVTGIILAIVFLRNSEKTETAPVMADVPEINEPEESDSIPDDWTKFLSDSPTPAQALEVLRTASESKGPDSSEAAMLYAALISRQARLLPADVINRYAELLPQNPEEAHARYEIALVNDSLNYKAAYEIGSDYAMGNGVEIDLEKASVTMKQGLQRAKLSGDKVYENLFETAIEKIGL